MVTSMFKAIICWWQVCPLAHVSLQKTKIDLQGHAGAPGLGRSSVTFSKGSAHPPQDQCTCDDAKQCFGTISLTSHFFFCRYCIFYVNCFHWLCMHLHSPTIMQLAAIIPGITIGSLAQDNTVITYARYVDVDGLVYDWSLGFHQYLCAFVNNYYSNWDTGCWCYPNVLMWWYLRRLWLLTKFVVAW